MADKPPIEETVHAENAGAGVETARNDSVDHKTAEQRAFANAQAANESEHTTTVLQAIRRYPWALMWSLTISMSVIMEGYDTILMSNFLGYPAFQKEFGSYHEGHGYQVSASWQSALWAGSIAGAIIGAFLNGYFTKKYGFRPVFLGFLILMCSFIFISFFGKTVNIQTVGQVLCGLPWGAFATLGPAYASELLPLALRPYLTAYVNMCFAIGQFIGAGALQSLIDREDEWSYRIPFAIQWVWPAPLFFCCLFMPESPWWLVRQGRLDDAEKTLRRITAGEEKQKAAQTLAMMVHTNNIEKEIEEGSSYMDCLRGVNLRRTEIACVAFAGQVLAGSQFAYSGTYFFEQAGMSPSDAYKLGLGGTAIAFIGTIIGWFFMNAFGRRRMYVYGMSLLVIYLFIIGVMTTAKRNNGVVWGQSAMCIIWLFTFSTTIGPLGWTIPAEVSSTRLRSKTVVLARNFYYLALLTANILEPYMVNPTQWGWRGYTGFFWCGAAIIALVWAIFRLPETKERTFEELDIMFAAKLPTRAFAKHHVDPYADGIEFADYSWKTNA